MVDFAFFEVVSGKGCNNMKLSVRTASVELAASIPATTVTAAAGPDNEAVLVRAAASSVIIAVEFIIGGVDKTVPGCCSCKEFPATTVTAAWVLLAAAVAEVESVN